MSVLLWAVVAVLAVALVVRVASRVFSPKTCFVCKQSFGGPIRWEDDLLASVIERLQAKAIFRGDDEVWGCRCGAVFHRHCENARRDELRRRNTSGWGACGKCGHVHGAYREGYVVKGSKATT